MALQNDRFTYRVTWSVDDDEVAGNLTPEIPSNMVTMIIQLGERHVRSAVRNASIQSAV